MVMHGIALHLMILHSFACHCIVLYGVTWCCIVGFGARAVSRKTPTYFMIMVIIMIKIVNQIVCELLRVKLLLGIPIEPKSTCPQKRYNTSKESKVGGKHFKE